MKKGETITLTIEDLNSEGLGIGHADGLVFFIKDAVIGDRVEAQIMKMKKSYGFARLQRILTPGPDRIAPACPIARQCGGCQIQEMSYAAQLRYKERKVSDDLKRIGGVENPPMEPILDMGTPFRYRNKALFPVGKDRNGQTIAGFYAGRTHTIVDCKDCLLGAEENRQILGLVLDHMKTLRIPPYDEQTGAGLVRHVMIRKAAATGQIMVCLVLNGDSLPGSGRLISALRAIPGMTAILINTNRQRTNVILGSRLKLLWGQNYIEDSIGGVRFHISPLSFYQVNPRQTEKLYAKALEYAGLTGGETVWDLYCGIGTISLFIAQKAGKVYGIEIIPDAIRDAKENARLNNITNAEFFVGKVEEILPQKYRDEHIAADVIFIDPPRKGCEQSVLDTMVQISPEKIVYVSCDPATLARDIKYLRANGYEVRRVCPVDMFGNSCHVETVCLMSRADK